MVYRYTQLGFCVLCIVWMSARAQAQLALLDVSQNQENTRHKVSISYKRQKIVGNANWLPQHKSPNDLWHEMGVSMTGTSRVIAFDRGNPKRVELEIGTFNWNDSLDEFDAPSLVGSVIVFEVLNSNTKLVSIRPKVELAVQSAIAQCLSSSRHGLMRKIEGQYSGTALSQPKENGKWILKVDDDYKQSIEAFSSTKFDLAHFNGTVRHTSDSLMNVPSSQVNAIATTASHKVGIGSCDFNETFWASWPKDRSFSYFRSRKIRQSKRIVRHRLEEGEYSEFELITEISQTFLDEL